MTFTDTNLENKPSMCMFNFTDLMSATSIQMKKRKLNVVKETQE